MRVLLFAIETVLEVTVIGVEPADILLIPRTLTGLLEKFMPISLVEISLLLCAPDITEEMALTPPNGWTRPDVTGDRFCCMVAIRGVDPAVLMPAVGKD